MLGESPLEQSGPTLEEFLGGSYDTPQLSAAEAVALFTYSDAITDPHDKFVHIQAAVADMARKPHVVPYARELQAMFAEVGPDKVLELARRMSDAAVVITQAMGVVPSENAYSPTWALWDMAKQRHWANENNQPADYRYRDHVGNALAEDKQAAKVRRACVYRHVGWELDYSNRIAYGSSAVLLMRQASGILGDVEGGHINDKGERDSFSLMVIGGLARDFLVKSGTRALLADALRRAFAADQGAQWGVQMLGQQHAESPDLAALHERERESLELAVKSIGNVLFAMGRVISWSPDRTIEVDERSFDDVLMSERHDRQLPGISDLPRRPRGGDPGLRG